MQQLRNGMQLYMFKMQEFLHVCSKQANNMVHRYPSSKLGALLSNTPKVWYIIVQYSIKKFNF